MLRHASDRRTLLWAFGLFPLNAALPYVFPAVVGWNLPLLLYSGFLAGVLAHNHNHVGVFVNKRLNALYGAWLSMFYGYPTFAWIPTHNQNHHKYTNGPGDATITNRYTDKNTWPVASSYPFVSMYWQSGPIKAYIADARANRPGRFQEVILQYTVVAAFQISAISLALWLYGPKQGLLVYLFGVGLPCFFAFWSMMFVNFIQHVHCDPKSKYNHSRNFVSPLANFLVFNNGYHTVHHDRAGMHWSQAAEAHAKIADKIDPELNQWSMIGFCIKAYLFSVFSDKYRTHPVASDAGAATTAG